MKRFIRLFSLLLVLGLPAAYPLSAAALCRYDGYVTGIWQVHYCVDGSDRIVPVEDSFSRLVIRDNGTADYWLGAEVYEATWAYSASLKTGYMFSFDLSYNGSSLPLPLLYSTASSSFGQIMIRVGDTVYVYEKV